VTAIEIRAVAVEQTRPLRVAILRPHETLEQIARSEPGRAYAVGAFDEDDLIAVGLIGPDPDRSDRAWRIRGMAVTPPSRGRGVGTAVLTALLEHASAMGARSVWCNARTPARSLYERAGFRAVSDEFELPEIGPHFVMELVLAPAAAG
jgi:GNAT superfamily N-acetyltransferase